MPPFKRLKSVMLNIWSFSRTVPYPPGRVRGGAGGALPPRHFTWRGISLSTQLLNYECARFRGRGSRGVARGARGSRRSRGPRSLSARGACTPSPLRKAATFGNSSANSLTARSKRLNSGSLLCNENAQSSGKSPK